MSETAYEFDTTTQLSNENGDQDRFAHYVDKEEITDSIVNGWPVVALCGKIWIPSRDPKNYQICPTCKKILEESEL